MVSQTLLRNLRQNNSGNQQEKNAKCRPQRPSEVQKQERNADDTARGFQQACHDAGQAINGLTCSEDTFHCVVVTVVLVLQSLCLTGHALSLWRLVQGGAGQADPMLLAKRQYLPVQVDIVRQNTLRVTTGTLPIPCHYPPEVPPIHCKAQNPAAHFSCGH